MKRRTFVTGTVTGAALATLGDSVPPKGIGTTELQQLRDGLHAVRVLDDAHGSHDVLPLAVRHLHRIRHIIHSAAHSDALRRQLFLLEGEAAAACAWLSFDAGKGDAARLYWGEAMTTARLTGDEALETRILAMLGLQAVHEGRPRQAQDFLRAGMQRAEGLGNTRLISVLAARQARAFAIGKDHDMARGALARASRLYERSQRGRPAPEWTAYYGPVDINMVQGHLYTQAGPPPRRRLVLPGGPVPPRPRLRPQPRLLPHPARPQPRPRR